MGETREKKAEERKKREEGEKIASREYCVEDKI